MKGKRLLAASLSIAMVFSLNTVAFADESNLPSEVQENTSILEDSDVSDEEETKEVIAEDNLKDGQVVATEEFSEVAQKGEFTWVFGENYQITNPEGYVVTGYEGITKEMTVEIIGGQNTVTEGKAIVEPVKVATGDEETTTPPTKGDKEEAKAETDTAKTSDPMTLGLLLAAMGASGAGIAGLRRKKKITKFP